MDLQILNIIAASRTSLLTTIMYGFTELGGGLIATIILLLAVAYFAIKLKKLPEAIILSLSLAVSQLLAHSLKFICQRPRPPLSLAVYTEYGYSMPSAHAFLATAFYGMLMILLARSIKNNVFRNILYGFFSLIIVGICFSRIYLGVHWPSDVLVGAVLGILLDLGLLSIEKIYYKSLHKLGKKK